MPSNVNVCLFVRSYRVSALGRAWDVSAERPENDGVQSTALVGRFSRKKLGIDPHGFPIPVCLADTFAGNPVRLRDTFENSGASTLHIWPSLARFFGAPCEHTKNKYLLDPNRNPMSRKANDTFLIF